ncbi:hypothetical protein ACIA98_37860 [Streptomyces sp. NPDC051366]|uniref:hypothetical protein n=1 Tax=Streptomyces sp. NPDC051366 TaxID=3365652 RepID=UPI0037994470
MAHQIRHKPRSRGSVIGSPALGTVLDVGLPGLPLGTGGYTTNESDAKVFAEAFAELDGQ